MLRGGGIFLVGCCVEVGFGRFVCVEFEEVWYNGRMMNGRKIWQPRKISVSLGTAVAVILLVLVGGFGVGFYWDRITANILPYISKNVKKPVAAPDWRGLDELFQTLSGSYDGDVDKGMVLNGAKRGMVEALGDEYTVFMDGKERKEFEKSLHGDVGAGVGIEMGVREGMVRVIRTLPDNPARRAGILAGDLIYKVNGEEVYRLTIDKVAERIRGPAGSEVNLTLVRDGVEQNYKIIREKINNVSAYVNYEGETAIVTVTRFDSDTGQLVEGFVDEFALKQVRKVILDLRGNGGGYLNTAVDILGLWVGGEKAVTQKSRHSADRPSYTVRGKDKLKDMKTVVLVNAGTASASEIVAGALKDYKKAVIVGEKTFGKGVVQSLVNLQSDELLKVTTARWYTPAGHTIHKTGIMPDHVVERSFADVNADRDPQLEFARGL